MSSGCVPVVFLSTWSAFGGHSPRAWPVPRAEDEGDFRVAWRLSFFLRGRRSV